MFRRLMTIAICVLGTGATAQTRNVYLQDEAGDRLPIATVEIAPDGTYDIAMDPTYFTDHFLSMRPFKCLDGPEKTWCHVPYPYEIERDISGGLTDLEYDLLFVWKGSGDYGINMWNGVYYSLSQDGATLTGTLREMDMDLLSVPPPAGELRPLNPADLHESDPAGHWLPYLVIE